MSRKYKDKIFRRKELHEARCGWCGRKIASGLCTVKRGSLFKVEFGYGSNYDLHEFHFEICDECFHKHMKDKASKSETRAYIL